MKYLMISLVGVCLLLTSVPALADQAADEAAIRKFMDESWALVNKHDAKGFAALTSDNFVCWSGRWKAPEGMVQNWTNYFANNEHVQMKQYEEVGIHFIAPDVAVYKARFEISGRVDSNGKSIPPAKNGGLWVLVRENGKWLYGAYTVFALTQ